MNWQADIFWQFSGEYYQTRSSLFLSLQDDYQLNINLLLLAIYLNQSQVSLSMSDWQALSHDIGDSEKQISLHRQQRRLAKQQDPEQYSALLSTELQLEKQQQQRIIGCLNQLDLQPCEKMNNLMSYCQSQQLRLTDILSRELDQLTNQNYAK